jgi:tetratricopeptide (TPR) repeat protein
MTDPIHELIASLTTAPGREGYSVRHSQLSVLVQARRAVAPDEWIAAVLVVVADLRRNYCDGVPDEQIARVALDAETMYLRCFEMDRTRTDLLDEAVFGLGRLAEILDESSEVLPAALTNLSAALRARYNKVTGDVADLNRAIEFGKRAMEITPQSHPWFPSRVNHFAAAMRDRYQQFGRVADLARALELEQTVVDDARVPIEQQAMLLHNVASGLSELYVISLERHHLRAAVMAHRRLTKTARRHALEELPRFLQGAGITERLWRDTAVGARRAVELQEESIRLTGLHDAELPSRLASLGRSLLELSRWSPAEESAGTLAKALATFDAALSRYTPASAGRRIAHLGRAECYELRWNRQGQASDLEAAFSEYRDALRGADETSLISVLGATRSAGLLALRSGRVDEAIAYLGTGLDATYQLVPRQLSRTDQRAWQRHAEDLAALAAVAHVRAEKAETAVEVLDTWRTRESAALAELLRPGANPTAAHQWIIKGGPAGTAVLEQPSGPASPKQPATRRWIAYLVCSEAGGCVIVQAPSGVAQATDLPRLTRAAVDRQRRRLQRAHDARRIDPTSYEEALRRHGRWAATMVVSSAVRLIPDDVPISFVACGPLAELPLLAAWRRASRGETRFLLLGRRVTFARSGRLAPKTLKPASSGSAVAVVSDASPILGTSIACAEAQAMTAYWPVRLLDGAACPPEAVLQAAANAAVIQLTCHGFAGRTDAAHSLVQLASGQITVAAILGTALRAAPIVFLSSCSLGAPDPQLPDQTFGPPTAFLHAGASVVIAPHTEVRSRHATVLATRFHYELSQGVAPDAALARAQQWVVATTAAAKRAFLINVADTAAAAGHEVADLRRFVDVLDRQGDGDTSAGLDAWCRFTANI